MGPPKVKRIAKYEVLDVLGKGGMGVVYKATDPAIGRLVAIKMITGGMVHDQDFLRRFYREAQSTGKLQHPNIVIVHDLGDEDGAPFLVMEYLEGESLQAIINAQRSLPLLDKLNYITQACNGLHYAHQRNVVHRDIKPANLMVLSDGQVKIVDFGVARIGNESVTRTGQVVGTIQYMSPEQINGAPVDCRTDIFSLGVVLYELLTYTLPFQGRDTGSTLLKIINEPPPALNQTLKSYPPELDMILQRALAKAREDRFPTAEDFGFELGQVQDQLKRELVSEYLKVAQDLIARCELSKAKEQIFQILKVDRQNRRANELLKDVQAQLHEQQRGEQVRELRATAIEAISSQQLDRALDCLEQAVSLDSQNAELQELRKQTLQARDRALKIREATRRAESAHCAGELDQALAAVEEALQLDPGCGEAQALRTVVTREIAERNREAQINELLTEAQRQISSRHFTTAIEALNRAEKLHPAAPALKELMVLAASGREQERRRKEIEQLNADIQDALNRDDYLTACAKAEAAAQRFPNDNGLLKLQALAERQKQAGEKRLFIEDHISRARKLLETGQTERALEILEAGSHKYPSDPALLSLFTVVRENLEQQRSESRKQEYVQRAKEALRHKNYREATGILEAASAELNAPAEIEDLLQFVKDEAATQSKRQVLDVAAQETHRLVSAEEYQQAIDFLKGILQEVSDEELEILLADAQRQLSEFNRRVKEAIASAERLLHGERYVEAVRYLESRVASCGKSPEFCAMLQRARHEQERISAVAAAAQRARLALSSQNFAAAANLVEECRQSFGDHPELSLVSAEIGARRREAANESLSRAIADARMFLLGRSYQPALEVLDEVAPFVDHAPTEMAERYRSLHQEARRGVDRKQAELSLAATAATAATASTRVRDDETTRYPLHQTASSLGEVASVAHDPDAVTQWPAGGDDGHSSVPASSIAEAPAPAVAPVIAGPTAGKIASDEIVAAPTVPTLQVKPPAVALQAPRRGPVTGSNKKLLWIVGVAAAVLLVVIAAGLRHRGTAAPAQAAASNDGYLEVIVQPWGTVKTLKSVDGKVVTVEEFTPVVVRAPAGNYTVTIAGPNGEEHTDQISVGANQRVRYQHTFEEVDATKIVNSY